MKVPARFRCMCGVTHVVPRERALDGIGVVHWGCTDCRRRFVLAHEPPDVYTPIYLDPSVRSVDARETGAANGAVSQKTPMPPPAIEFVCRCGEPLTAHSWMYGGTTACPRCRTSLLVAVKYHVKRKQFVVVPEYPHTTASA